MSVKAFNALPRKPRSPSGLPNHWHFDLRFVHLEPNPSHVLFLVQLDSSYIHSERLPLGISAPMSGMEFFPETGFEAAPEVAKALIHSFVDNFGLKKFEPNPPPALAPWTLTTEDPQLATAVGEEFKKMGVRAELCKIHVVKGKALTTAQLAFDGFWKTLKTQIGITGLPGDVLTTPDSIGFANYRTATWVGDVNDDDTQKALAYTQRLSTTRPISVEIDPRDAGEGIVKEMQIVLELIDTKSTDQVRAEADAGNAEAAIDYALRVQFGIGCTPSRQLSRVYLVKVISNPHASSVHKSMAHALLIEWFTKASTGDFRKRYLHAAAHHATQAVELAEGNGCPAVLFFGARILEPMSHTALELCLQYKPVWNALENRKKQMEKEHGKAEEKRVKRANRYRCANVGCGVQADTGKMLSQCAGKCDSDKKPSYCSKECQRADWKTHKPFCKPNAPCSIIEEPVPSTGGASKYGALSIPITGPDGESRVLSSSTMSAKMLKEIKEYTEGRGGSSSASASGTSAIPGPPLHVEVERLL